MKQAPQLDAEMHFQEKNNEQQNSAAPKKLRRR
jgi:hypothetical protein